MDTEFVTFIGGKRVVGQKVFVGHNPRIFYLLMKEGRFDRLVDSPQQPTVRTSYQGTPGDKVVREDPEARLQRVLAAPRIDLQKVDPDPPENPGKEPWNILPAFILVAPFTVPFIPLRLAEDASDRAWQNRLQGKFSTLPPEASRASLLKAFGKPFRIVPDGKGHTDLHFGPATPLSASPQLAYKKVLVRLQGARISGVFSDDFYQDPGINNGTARNGRQAR